MKWILFDTSYVCYRIGYTMSEDDLYGPDGLSMVLYGLFEFIRKVCRDSRVGKTNRVVFCVDSPTSFRREVYPEYKRHRKELSEADKKRHRAVHKYIQTLSQDILPRIGFPVLKQEGLEADDVIAKSCEVITEAGEAAVIVSSDADLYQCLTPQIAIFDGHHKYFNRNTFHNKYGCWPEDWGTVKAIAGCPSDNVTGVKGVGTVIAIQYITNRLAETSVRYARIAENRELIERNREIVTLPHHKTQAVCLHDPVYDYAAFTEIVEEHGMFPYKTQHALSVWWANFFGVEVRRFRKRRPRNETHS